VDVVQGIKNIGSIRTIGVTTNGMVLGRKLKPLREAGVNAFNISLDTLVEPKFTFITRRSGHSRVLESIHEAVGSREEGEVVKVNCVVMRGVNDDELGDFVSMTEKLPVDVRFIEYMPFDGNKWSEGKFLPYKDQLKIIRERHPDIQQMTNDKHDTSKGWHVPGYAGTFGFITSMTSHFCGGCNRLRLTADGNIKVCLFDNAEVSLRDAMRRGASDEELSDIIGAALGQKKASLGGHKDRFELSKAPNRSMIRIGG
jgi:molybdenum cofactor biosynthesis enzyme MoaA